jgi:hypothetical protein
MKATSALHRLRPWEVFLFGILDSDGLVCSRILTLVVSALSGFTGGGRSIVVLGVVQPAWCERKVSD